MTFSIRLIMYSIFFLVYFCLFLLFFVSVAVWLVGWVSPGSLRWP